jgi:hypothetical protein
VSCERQEAFVGAYNVSFNLYTDVREEDIPCAVKAYIRCAQVQGNGSTDAWNGVWEEAAPPYGICGMKASCEEVAPAVYDHENCKKIKE